MALLKLFNQSVNGHLVATRILCPDCADVLSGLSAVQTVYRASAACVVCGEPNNPHCRACHMTDHPASAMQPLFCTECVQAMLRGRANRFD